MLLLLVGPEGLYQFLLGPEFPFITDDEKEQLAFARATATEGRMYLHLDAEFIIPV